MGLSTNTTTYTGTNLFPLNFAMGVLDRDDVTVQVNKEEINGTPVYRDFEWIDDSNIRILSDLNIGDVVTVDRTVSKQYLDVNFTNTENNVTKENLDRQTKQAMMAVQEIIDGRFDKFTDLEKTVRSIIDAIKEINSDRAVSDWRFISSLCDLDTSLNLEPEDNFLLLPSLCELD